MASPRYRFTIGRMMVAVLAVGLLLGWVCWFEASRAAAHRERAADITANRWGQYNATSDVEAGRIARELARPWAEGGPSWILVVMGVVLIGGMLSLSESIYRVRKAHRQRKDGSAGI